MGPFVDFGETILAQRNKFELPSINAVGTGKEILKGKRTMRSKFGGLISTAMKIESINQDFHSLVNMNTMRVRMERQDLISSTLRLISAAIVRK